MIEEKYKFVIEKFGGYAKWNHDSKYFTSLLSKSSDLSSYFEVLKDPNWIKSMNEEIEALNWNGTWEIADLPYGRKPIGCKWVYKIKYESICEIEGYKARLVAKGYNQHELLDFDETFSPIVKNSNY